MCDLTNNYIEAEGIRAYGISFNKITRDHNLDATITEEDVLVDKSAQDLIDSI